MDTKPIEAAPVSGTGSVGSTGSVGNWYLVTGLLLGLAIGLVISLLILPLTNSEALPQELSRADAGLYRGMIAQAFVSAPNVERAKSRLALLGDGDLAAALTAQAQEELALGGSEGLARALAQLAAALQWDSAK